MGKQIQEMLLELVRIFTSADEFRSPGWLWMLLLVPVYLVWYAFYYDSRRLMVRLSYDPEKITKSSAATSWLRFIPMLLQMAGFLLLVIALARPQSASEVRERKSQGIDIMILLDISASMETQDFEGGRLKHAKALAQKFIEGRQGDRIGIVLFANGAYSYAPLTLDYNLLKKLIVPITHTMMNKSGTAIGTAIGIGIHRLENSPSPSKVMILITDGASNVGELPPVTVAQIAGDKGMRIYPVAIGRPEWEGKPTDLDEPTLMKVAEATGGKFFRATDEKSFAEVMQTISSMEKVEFTEEVTRELTDVYPPVLLAGILLFALSWLLSVTFLHNPFEG